MNKPKANYDTTYCMNKKCKKKCWRNFDNWEFDNRGRYILMERCKEYKE